MTFACMGFVSEQMITTQIQCKTPPEPTPYQAVPLHHLPAPKTRHLDKSGGSVAHYDPLTSLGDWGEGVVHVTTGTSLC